MLSAGPDRPFGYGENRRNCARCGEVTGLPMNVPPLALDEPLSPELVLVLPPELRAQVLAALPVPAWPAPRPRVLAVSPAAAEPVAPSLGRIFVSRAAQLAMIFVAVTLVTLAMSLVAHAVR
jgi:hypothetical protein